MPVPSISSAEPDVLVIGGGTAALCAAISARRAGASVCLLEQAPRALRGGSTRHARNLRFAHELDTPLASGPYPAHEFLSDLARVAGAGMDPDLAERLIAHSAEVPDWLAGAGVHFQLSSSGSVPASRKTAFLLGGGKSMLNALYAIAERSGVDIRYECEARGVSIEGGRLTRVLIGRGASTRAMCPGAAIACCGGAQGNRDWLRAHWGEAADGFVNRGTPFAGGGLLLSMLDQGARPVGDPKSAHLVAVDARSPPDDGGIVTRVRAMPAGIVVDRTGRRLDDEGGDTASTRYARWGQRVAACPGQIAYLILDAPGLRNAAPAVYDPIGASSIPGLAAALGIPGDALAETVARYNAAVRRLPADDPGQWRTEGLSPPKSRHARPLTEPPFAAYPMRPGITFTHYGVAVDERARVQLDRGGPVSSLFAAGVIMAPALLGGGYISGLALTIGIVFGRIAGEEAVRHVRV